MKVGDFIKFRFPFPVGEYISPWRYGIVISEYDKKNIASYVRIFIWDD